MNDGRLTWCATCGAKLNLLGRCTFGQCPSRDTTCPECRNPDGSLNAEWAEANGSCTFGCGRTIDRDFGFCSWCKDHSANRAECETCGAMYEDWSGTYEPAAG